MHYPEFVAAREAAGRPAPLRGLPRGEARRVVRRVNRGADLRGPRDVWLRTMPFLIGVAVALAVGVFGTLTGLDRERAFYATALVVIASYYILYAVIGGSLQALGPELLIFAVFTALAAWGFRRDLRLVIIGLVAHGVMDFFHGGLVTNAGVPAWWPAWCAAYDLTAPAYLAVLISRGRVAARPANG